MARKKEESSLKDNVEIRFAAVRRNDAANDGENEKERFLESMNWFYFE